MGTAERSPGSETAIEVLAQEGVAVRSTDQSAARRSQSVERGLQHCCSVAASREDDASPQKAASDGGAISWTASKEVEGSEQGSQRHQVDHRQNQGSESGSESG